MSGMSRCPGSVNYEFIVFLHGANTKATRTSKTSTIIKSFNKAPPFSVIELVLYLKSTMDKKLKQKKPIELKINKYVFPV